MNSKHVHIPFFSWLLILLTFELLTSCIHPKIKFQKSRLLDPMMDPAKTQGYYRSFFSEPFQMVEHGSGDLGGAMGGSCPTCGG